MAENETQKMLKAILLMQVEILGRIERLENVEEYEKEQAQKAKAKILGKATPEFDSAQLNALIEADAITLNKDWTKIESMLNSFVENINHDGKPS